MNKNKSRIIALSLVAVLGTSSLLGVLLGVGTTASAVEIQLDMDNSKDNEQDDTYKVDEETVETEEIIEGEDNISDEIYHSGLDIYEIEIKEEEIEADDIEVYIRGYNDADGNYISNYKKIEFPDGVGPLIIENRTLLPIRGIAETVGFTVEYNNTTQVVKILKDVTDWDWESGELPVQCENMLDIMKSRALDNPNRDESLSVPYLYFNRVKLNMSDVDDLRQRILDSRMARYGINLQLGSNTGSSYVGKIDRFGADSGRMDYTMDISARLYKERTMIPLRAVGEMLGFEVSWDGASRRVLIDGTRN